MSDTDHSHHHHAANEFAGSVPPVMDRAFWDERYASRDALWSGKPNQQLVDEVADLPPGTALDVGCGEGADAIWLATRGWPVFGIDLSGVAIERARIRGNRAGDEVTGRLTFDTVDLAEFDPGVAAFDLVSAQFVHVPADQRALVHRRLAAAVTVGGTLVIVNHDPSDLDTTIGRPPFPEFFASAAELAANLPSDTWEVVVAEARPRPAIDPEGRSVTIHDAVLRAVRTG
jgi:2-polyprenyl-3-methyl-5-hydroxy-6-metoxy-1,4-benzoquinol methylase